MSLERKIAGSLTGYIKGQAIIVILNSIIFLFILNIFKVRFALFLALLTGILSTVPIIGMGTAALIAFLVSVFDGRQLLFIPPFFEGIMLLAVYLILNQIIDGGDCSPYPEIISDIPCIIYRHIEIYPNQSPLSIDIYIVELV